MVESARRSEVCQCGKAEAYRMARIAEQACCILDEVRIWLAKG